MDFIIKKHFERTDMEKDNGLGTSKIVHIALGVNNIEETAKKISDIFGLEVPEIIDPVNNKKDYPTYYNGAVTESYYKACEFKMGNISLELLEPVGEPNPVRDFLNKNNSNGIHHILFLVEDLESKIKYLENKGLKVSGTGKFPGGKYAFLDFKEIGVSLELGELS